MQPAARSGRLAGLIVVVALAVATTTAFAATSASAAKGPLDTSPDGPPGHGGAPRGNSGGSQGNAFGKIPGGPQSLAPPGADGVPGRGLANGHRDAPSGPDAPSVPPIVVAGESFSPPIPPPGEGSGPPIAGPATPAIPSTPGSRSSSEDPPGEAFLVNPVGTGRGRTEAEPRGPIQDAALDAGSGSSAFGGSLFLAPSSGSPFTAPDARGLGWWLIAAILLSATVGFVVRHVTLRGAMENARRSATRDPLTGLANRRLFDETLTREVARQRRRGEPLALLMIDLDAFKQVNDSRGHVAGDAVLCAVADAIRARVRTSDLPARLGGDEFAVILPDCSGPDAQALGEHLRGQIADAAGSPVTASVGVAVVPDDAVEADALVVAADDALYAAKEAGRDQLVVAGTAAD